MITALKHFRRKPTWKAHDVLLTKFPVLRSASFSPRFHVAYHHHFLHTLIPNMQKFTRQKLTILLRITDYCCVPHGTKQCHKVFLGTAGYYNIGLLATKYYKVPLRTTKYYWVLLSLTWSHSVLQRSTREQFVLENIHPYYKVLVCAPTCHNVLHNGYPYCKALRRYHDSTRQNESVLHRV